MCTSLSRGDIVLANVAYNENNPHMHFGRHFYVLVCNQKCLKASPVVQAVPLTSNTNRRLPTQVEVSGGMLSKQSYALVEQLALLPKEVFLNGKYCGKIDDESMKSIEKCIKVQLQLV